MKQLNTLFLLFALLISVNIMGQTLTISATGDTGTSGTNWSASGTNPVTIAVTGTADINVSVIQDLLNSGTDVVLNSTVDINWDSPLNATAVEGDLTLTGPTSGSSYKDANINANINITGNLSFSNSKLDVIVSPGINLNIGGDLTIDNTGGIVLDSNSTAFSSLMVGGDISGTRGMSYLRWSNPTPGNDLLSSPFGNVQWGMVFEMNVGKFLSGNISGVLHYLFGPYDESINNYGTLFYQYMPDVTLPAGVGYRVGRLDTQVTDNQKIEFPVWDISSYNNAHKSNVTVALTHTGEGWNLIGNPYPTYLSLSSVLNNNSANMYGGAYNAIYSYNGDAVNPWTVYNNLSSAKIAPGQAFFVRSAVGGSNFSFTPAMQSATGGDDFIQGRNASDNQVYNTGIILSSNLGTYSTDVYFHPMGSDGLDVGYDAATWQGSTPSYSIYSHLVSENQGLSMAIQTLHSNVLSEEVTTIIPLGIEVPSSQQFSLSLSDSSYLPDSGNIYLEDRHLGVFTNLREQSYSISSGNGISGVGRFYIHAGSNATLSNAIEIYDSIGVYAPTGRDVIVVTGVTEPNMHLSIYDITGRMLLDHKLSATSTQEVPVSQLSTGAVIAHLEGSQGSRSIKLIINP